MGPVEVRRSRGGWQRCPSAAQRSGEIDDEPERWWGGKQSGGREKSRHAGKRRRWEAENASHATRKKKTPTLQQQAHFTRQADHPIHSPIHTRYAHRHRPPRRHARRLEAANRIPRMLGVLWPPYACRPPVGHSTGSTRASLGRLPRTAGQAPRRATRRRPEQTRQTRPRRRLIDARWALPPGGGEGAGGGGDTTRASDLAMGGQD